MIRFYYNHSSEEPNVASFDYGSISSETKVKAIRFSGACTSGYGKSDNPKEPTFWMQCEGRVEVVSGVAYIYSL